MTCLHPPGLACRPEFGCGPLPDGARDPQLTGMPEEMADWNSDEEEAA